MDLLSDLIAKSRPSAAVAPGADGGTKRKASKYLSRRERERAEAKARRKQKRREDSARTSADPPAVPPTGTATASRASSGGGVVPGGAAPSAGAAVAAAAAETAETAEADGAGTVTLPRAEVVRLLRERGEPVTLFGETDAMRHARLRELERTGLGSKAEKMATALQQRVPHMTAEEEEEEDKQELQELQERQQQQQQQKSEQPERTGQAATDPIAEHVARFINRMLREWRDKLENRSDEVKASVQGGKEKRTYSECKRYLKPFLKLLRNNGVRPEILSRVRSIVAHCEQREYVQAADEYIQLAIGNAAWPIGVTMVGIHARRGRERINQDQVAHVMNDEAQRKYITALKRLMTFCQQQHPAAPSQMLQ